MYSSQSVSVDFAARHLLGASSSILPHGTWSLCHGRKAVISPLAGPSSQLTTPGDSSKQDGAYSVQLISPEQKRSATVSMNASQPSITLVLMATRSAKTRISVMAEPDTAICDRKPSSRLPIVKTFPSPPMTSTVTFPARWLGSRLLTSIGKGVLSTKKSPPWVVVLLGPPKVRISNWALPLYGAGVPMSPMHCSKASSPAPAQSVTHC